MYTHTLIIRCITFVHIKLIIVCGWWHHDFFYMLVDLIGGRGREREEGKGADGQGPGEGEAYEGHVVG